MNFTKIYYMKIFTRKIKTTKFIYGNVTCVSDHEGCTLDYYSIPNTAIHVVNLHAATFCERSIITNHRMFGDYVHGVIII